MAQQGLLNYNHPELTSLSRYNKITNQNYDPEGDKLITSTSKPYIMPDAPNKQNQSTQQNYTPENTRLLLYNLTIKELFLNTINAWLGIIYDILNRRFENILTKEHRLSYIGLTLMIISIVLIVIL